MKKRLLVFTIVAVLLFAIPTEAATTRALKVSPSLSFSGTTATCSVLVMADRPSDQIELTMKLWDGSKCIKTWSTTGNGNLLLEKNAAVVMGKTYKLTADISINGTGKPTVSITGTCQ
ncbi:MAG: hypothetical protein ACI317_03450 [Floccifex porci]|uniref:hypothetical protein n=1 Tax=Floccifex porci TaxID=2606629 RepID=UPI003EFF57DE